MGDVKGHTLAVKALMNEGVEVGFFILGGPMGGIAADFVKEGLKLIDVRHEQAAAMAAHAYARVSGKPGVCFAASGPGVTNLVTGVATAHADRCPIIVLGGSSSYDQWHSDAFQEMDQVTMMQPFTKWSERIAHVKRVPAMVSMAFRHALTGCPGPVYLDFPQEIVNGTVDEDTVSFPRDYRPRSRPQGEPASVARAIDALADAQRPVVVSGSGILWSEAHEELAQFVRQTGIPFYTTPLGRGVVPEDDPLCFLAARSSAFKNADVALVIGTRPNYVIGQLLPPRWSPDLRVIMANIEPTHIGLNRPVDIDILGDAKMVLQQLSSEARGKIDGGRYEDWVDQLRREDAARRERQDRLESSDETPIHPLRVCKEVRDLLPRDGILVVDGHETLNFSRQSIPSFYPRHRLNSTHAGCMGVGMPFGLGAKVASPDSMVVVLHGDGSFGMNAMELDTAVRCGLPILTVIINNAGWTGMYGGPKNPGRDLGYTRYDQMFAPAGVHPEYVERPEELKPALQRAAKAVESGKPALVNVKCDEHAQATTQSFYT